jgi:hypothetical protein
MKLDCLVGILSVKPLPSQRMHPFLCTIKHMLSECKLVILAQHNLQQTHVDTWAAFKGIDPLDRQRVRYWKVLAPDNLALRPIKVGKIAAGPALLQSSDRTKEFSTDGAPLKYI